MKRLLLLRHAKAETGTSDQNDFDRALTARGVADAAAMTRYIQGRDYKPDRILCSAALRTRQTAAMLAAAAYPIAYLDALYLAQRGRIAATVNDASDADACLLIIGHNPGLEQVATVFAREPVRPREQDRHDRLEEKFPTAALAVLDFDVAHWRQASPGGGRLVDFARPRDI